MRMIQRNLKFLNGYSGARVFRGADCMMCFNGHPYKKGMP